MHKEIQNHKLPERMTHAGHNVGMAQRSGALNLLRIRLRAHYGLHCALCIVHYDLSTNCITLCP